MSKNKNPTNINGNNTYQLLAGVDSNKDQSYFLCQLSQERTVQIFFL